MPKLDSSVKAVYKGTSPGIKIYKGTQFVWPLAVDVISNEVRTRTVLYTENVPTSFTPAHLYWFKAPASGKVIIRIWWDLTYYQASSGTAMLGKCQLRIRPDTLVATPIFDVVVIQQGHDARVRNVLQLIQGLTPYRAYNAELLSFLTSAPSSLENAPLTESFDILMA